MVNLIENPQQIQGNEPLILQNPQQVWLVKSGFLAIFTVVIANGESIGHRHYLFTVKAGEAMFGVGLIPTDREDEHRTFIAVPIQATELQAMSVSQWLAKDDLNDGLQLIDTWLHHCNEWLSQHAMTIPTNTVSGVGAQYITLTSGQTLLPESKNITWVQIKQGNMTWLGLEELKIDSSSGIFPLTPGMWLQAKTLVELYVCSTKELTSPELIPPASVAVHPSLLALQNYLCTYINNVLEQEKQQQFQQFRDRERLNTNARETAFGKLVGVLHKQEDVVDEDGTELLIAVGMIGKVMGINIQPPAASEDLSKVKEPLEAISRASQFRTRRVILAGPWWEQEHGPLLGYTQEQRPVALIPDAQKGYILFDPITRERTRITKELNERLSPEAYMFYRPLPTVVKKTLDVFSFSIRGHYKDILFIIILGILGSLLGMVTPQITAMLVNNAIPDADRILLWQMGLALFAAAFGKTAFELAQGFLTSRVESAADSNLQPAVWDRLLRLSPGFFRKYNSGDLLTRLMTVGQIRSKLSGATQRSLLSGIFALLNLVLMFVYSNKLALVATAITVVIVIITTVSSSELVKKGREQEDLDGLLSSLSVELINGVAKIRVAAAEERAFATWAKLYTKRTKVVSRVKQIDNSVSTMNEAVPIISSVLIFWFSVLFMQMAQAKGEPPTLTIGSFLAFNSAFGTFLSGVVGLSNTLTDVLGIIPLWERVQPLLQTPIESDENKADPGRLRGRVAIDHVTFRYREDGAMILDDVSVHANPGEFIALVGPSGSGKSTIFRLLLGFESPISGAVYYDGQDMAGLNVEAVRRQLGVVLQSGRISAGSIFENITAGALITLNEAWEAARMAGFAEDVEKMPMGMHTVISEGGSNLSGGQRQRLLIARSLVSKPKVILMDEATSALDNRTQAIVTESIDRLNATRVVIAHRLSTIRNADRIYVLEAGRVVQVGNFDELVAQEGLFARLVARQLE